jgi:hypothetical protein
MRKTLIALNLCAALLVFVHGAFAAEPAAQTPAAPAARTCAPAPFLAPVPATSTVAQAVPAPAADTRRVDFATWLTARDRNLPGLVPMNAICTKCYAQGDGCCCDLRPYICYCC